jgi:hypothetical protein
VKQRSLPRSDLKVPFVTEALLIFARIVGTGMRPVNFGETLKHLVRRLLGRGRSETKWKLQLGSAERE